VSFLLSTSSFFSTFSLSLSLPPPPPKKNSQIGNKRLTDRLRGQQRRVRRERHMRRGGRGGGRGRRRRGVLARERRRRRVCRRPLFPCQRPLLGLPHLLPLLLLLLETILQVREPQHVHQAVHVGLAREVDARAHVAERRVDVLGVGRAEPVHRRLVVLVLLGLLRGRRFFHHRFFSSSSLCRGVSRCGSQAAGEGGSGDDGGGRGRGGDLGPAAGGQRQVRPRRPPRRAVRGRRARQARRVGVRLEGGRRLGPVVEARGARALVADVGEVAQELPEERRGDFPSDGQLGPRLDAVFVGNDLFFSVWGGVFERGLEGWERKGDGKRDEFFGAPKNKGGVLSRENLQLLSLSLSPRRPAPSPCGRPARAGPCPPGACCGSHRTWPSRRCRGSC